jgi:phosphate transport system protein
MGSEAQEMVKHAVEATLNGDHALAAYVIRSDDTVDHYERSAVTKTVVAVMQESPVATDLRFLISTLGVVGEIEKTGDDAVKLARRAAKLSGQFPIEMKVALLQLGDLARKSFSSSLRLYSEYSPMLAKEIIDGDKLVDTAYSQARDRVIKLIEANPSATGYLVGTIECFHALEHVADHAVAIAVRMKMLYEAEAESSSN